MCGLIASFVAGGSDHSLAALQAGLGRMNARGPDGEGFWQSEEARLGHRRLAVVDLEPRAAQPMQSACGRYVAILNGEIYNFAALRDELQATGVTFRTKSDTEVLLELFAVQGEAMLPKLHGMFAFVIWDKETRRAFVARDPYGIKPLYLASVRDGLVLASQVRALLATGLVDRTPDLRAQAGFWLLGSVPEPYTWYRDIRAFPAGHCTWIANGRMAEPRRWHDIGDAWRFAGEQRRPPGAAVQDAVRRALQESVSRHLAADVPVAVFLSGGIDSGAMAALMLEAGARDLEGVTIAYDEFAERHEDEAPVAAKLAAHYGIRHYVRRVTREEFRTDLPRILAAMDQPSIDGVNTWYAAKAVAERGYKVVVSGVGGDELFHGYESFRQLPRMVAHRRWLGRIPGAVYLLTTAGRLHARRSGNMRWAHLADWSRTIGGAWWLRRSLHAPEDLPALMGRDEAEWAMRDLDPDDWVRETCGPLPDDPVLALGLIESSTYLRNQLLRDSDWASMDHGVELRTPLVDAYLLSQLQPWMGVFARYPGKALLARAPAKPLPAEIIERRKTGFGIPVSNWMGAGEVGMGGAGSRQWAREVARAYTDSLS